MQIFKHIHRDKVMFRLNYLLGVVVLLASGAFYRDQASQLKLVVQNPITLPVPLKAFPLIINSWAGQDIPIPDHIQRIAGNDDFINRLYINKSTNQWVNVYLAYSGNPRTMVGHKPEICYVGAGWVHDSSEQSEVLSSTGKSIPCLIHHFHRPTLNRNEIIVLNFYVLNGQVISNESGFSGIGWRTPNIAGNPASYVAQAQISSVLETNVRMAARDIIDPIFDFLPDNNGAVKATKYTQAGNGILK